MEVGKTTYVPFPSPRVYFQFYHLIGLINFLTFLLKIPILGGGIWLSARPTNTDCLKFLQWPLMRNTILMRIYLWVMFFVVAALIGFIIFAYAVTDKGSGRPVPVRVYLDYYLEDYSGWLDECVGNHGYWAKIISCIRDSSVCPRTRRVIGGVPESVDM